MSSSKNWAHKYLIDPLTEPTPSQETGPGASHVNQYVASGASLLNRPRSVVADSYGDHHILPSTSYSVQLNRVHENYPYPSTRVGASQQFEPTYSPLLQRKSQVTRPRELAMNEFQSAPSGSRSRDPRRHTVNFYSTSSHPVQEHRGQSGHARHSSGHGHKRHHSRAEPHSFNRWSHHYHPLPELKTKSRVPDASLGVSRESSPLESIRSSLDLNGVSFYQGGPYDAVLPRRNIDVRYSPLAAVHDSNMEALRATPQHHIKDCLKRHLPLQGTATVPSGGVDMHGNIMEYEEGADLMREPDAAGGAYKRWDNLDYNPQDLKGKSEPQFSIDKAKKAEKLRKRGASKEAPPAAAKSSSGTDAKVKKAIGGLRMKFLGKKDNLATSVY